MRRSVAVQAPPPWAGPWKRVAFAYASRDLPAQILQGLGVLTEEVADALAVVVLDGADDGGGAIAVALPRARERGERIAGGARHLRDAPEDPPVRRAIRQ